MKCNQSFSRLFDGSLPGLVEPSDYAELLHLEDERGQAQPKGGVIPRKLMRAQNILLNPRKWFDITYFFMVDLSLNYI